MIERARDHGERFARERHETDPIRFPSFHEADHFPLGNFDPVVGPEVLRQHRARDVDRQHDRHALLLGLHPFPQAHGLDEGEHDERQRQRSEHAGPEPPNEASSAGGASDPHWSRVREPHPPLAGDEPTHGEQRQEGQIRPARAGEVVHAAPSRSAPAVASVSSDSAPPASVPFVSGAPVATVRPSRSSRAATAARRCVSSRTQDAPALIESSGAFPDGATRAKRTRTECLKAAARSRFPFVSRPSEAPDAKPGSLRRTCAACLPARRTTGAP